MTGIKKSSPRLALCLFYSLLSVPSPARLSLSPAGLWERRTVWFRSLLCRQPLAEGSEDVCPKRCGGGRMPPLQSQGGWCDVTISLLHACTHAHARILIFSLAHTCFLSYWKFRWYQVLAGWLSFRKAADNCRSYWSSPQWTRQSEPFITSIIWKWQQLVLLTPHPSLNSDF